MFLIMLKFIEIYFTFKISFTSSYNQSFSFRMLNRWIEESESSGIMVSKKDEEERMKEREIEKNKLKKSEGKNKIIY
jgi:hypothetical protein